MGSEVSPLFRQDQWRYVPGDLEVDRHFDGHVPILKGYHGHLGNLAIPLLMKSATKRREFLGNSGEHASTKYLQGRLVLCVRNF